MPDLDNYFPVIDNDLPCSVAQAKAFEAELDARMGEAKHWRQVTVYPATLKQIRDEIDRCEALSKSLTAGSVVDGLTKRAAALQWALDLIEGK